MHRHHDRIWKPQRIGCGTALALVVGLATTPTASALAGPAPADDAADEEKDTRSRRQKLHEQRVDYVEGRLATLMPHLADTSKKKKLADSLGSASAPDELAMLADCLGTTCTLNALGHARILVDWTTLRSELDLVDKEIPPPANALGGPAALLGAGPLAAAVTSSATTAIETLRVWTERAIKRRLQREAIVALVDRLTNELCMDAARGLLPRTCGLAKNEALNHVSAGNAQLGVIRAAVRADLADLPARSFVTDDAVFPVAELDTARRRFVERLRIGESPALLFPQLGRDVRGGGKTPSTDARGHTACYLELAPRALDFSDPLAGQSDDLAAAAAFVAATVTTSDCDGIVLGAGTGSVKAGIAAWAGKHDVLVAVTGPWRVAVAAAKNYATSAATLIDPPQQSDTAAASAEARVERARRHGLAATAFAAAMDRLAIAFVESMHPTPSKPDDDAVLALRGLLRRIELVELTVVDDWGRLIVDLSRASSDTNGDEERKELRKLSGLLTALATEQSSDELFAAVQAAALPAASWRTKMKSEAFTASIGAQLGITSAAELRFGTYGASYYSGKEVAWAAPTLFFPMGLDLAWKKKNATHGAFFSVIDPAAFLQYDIHEGGRLPGARLTTIVAPGVAWRVSLGDRPLSFMLYAVFRPQLRTWEPTISGPGASVLQFGAAFTWDIPFYVFRSRKAGQ